MSNSRLFSSIITILVFSLILLIPPPSRSGEVKRLHVGYMDSLSQLPLITAYERDRFSLKTLEVILENYHSPLALEAAFRAGAVDVAYLPLSTAISIKLDLKTAGLGESLHRSKGGVVVRKNRWLNKSSKVLGDVGILGTHSPGHFGLLDFLDRNGFEYGLGCRARVVWQENLEDIFNNEQVAGFALPEPFLTEVMLHSNVDLVQELYEEIPFVLLYRPEIMTPDWTSSLSEWLKGVRQACNFLDRDIGLFGGEQSLMTLSRYMDFDKDLIRLVFLKTPVLLNYASWFVSHDKIEETNMAMQGLKLNMNTIGRVKLIDPVRLAELTISGEFE